MVRFLEILALVLAAVTLTFPLAHAAELPGKLRLSKDAYAAVQPIYYPGFTLGALSEPAMIAALALLLVWMPRGHSAFWWILGSLAALALMHLVYWVVVHPVNRFWLKDQNLVGLSASFFSFGQGRDRSGSRGPPEWTKLRDRWEYGHVIRAGLAGLGFVCLAIAVT
jgi:Domain of unknown function (DUF1772)